MLYGVLLVTSLALALLGTWLWLRTARRFGIFERPGPRKSHADTVPTLGGVAVAAAFFIAIFILVGWSRVPGLTRATTAMLLGALPILAVSIYDDLREAPIWLRLVCQLAGAAVFVLLVDPFRYVRLTNASLDFGLASYPLAMLWILLIANSLNFIDGIDGLAAGTAAVAGLVLAISALARHQPVPALLALALVGVCLGFLRFNFPPAQVFMGDTGAVFLGYALAVVALLGAGKSVALVALLVPILALGVPIFDLVAAVVRRSRQRRSILAADREHVHHQLLGFGVTPRRAVLLLYLVSALLGAVALGLFYQTRVIALAIVAVGLVLGIIFLRR